MHSHFVEKVSTQQKEEEKELVLFILYWMLKYDDFFTFRKRIEFFILFVNF